MLTIIRCYDSFLEEEIQRVDELMDKLRIDGITGQYDSSENAFWQDGAYIYSVVL